MSIFKDSGIIIKITKLDNKEFLYTIFTEKFWKIITRKKISKKEKTLDLWYYITCEIESSKKSDINKIWWIKILSEFLSKNTEYQNGKKFSEINNYLMLLNTILKKTAFWVPNTPILEIIKKINKYNKNDLEMKLILSNLKVINVLWELNIENKDITISKILKFINKNEITNILKLSWINEKQKKKLQNIL